MGLLTQALAGGVAAAANTGADMLKAGYAADLQAERDKANALREENLTRLRAQLTEQGADKQRAFETQKADKEYGRGSSGLLDVETGAPLTREEAKAKGGDATITPEDNKLSTEFLVDGKPASNYDVKLALQDKPGSVTRVKEVDAEARIAAMKEVTQMKLDSAREIADLKLQQARDLLNIKINAGHSQESAEVKKLMAEIRKTEEQRKAADSAAKMLDATGGDMNPEQQKLYNNYLTMAGVEASAAPAKEKPKKKGLIASFFGGDDADAKPAPAPAAAAPPLSSGARGKYDFNSLPKGSEPVPGKFTKDGRPVFKAPNGKLVAPQLQ